MDGEALAEAGRAIDFDMRGFIENSLLEWENKVAAVVVAGGCNLRCPFCHSWRYVTGLPNLEKQDIDVLFTLLERQKGWIDGVVFTGGEPTLQPGLTELIRRARGYGVAVKLHTNGSRPGIVATLLGEGLVDCLALDYKSPLDKRFFAASGINADPAALEAVRDTFRLAAGSGVEREYHTTLAPRYIDADALAVMAERLESGGLWILQQFENGDCLDRRLVGSRRYDNDQLSALEVVARRWHNRVLMKRGTSA